MRDSITIKAILVCEVEEKFNLCGGPYSDGAVRNALTQTLRNRLLLKAVHSLLEDRLSIQASDGSASWNVE